MALLSRVVFILFLSQAVHADFLSDAPWIPRGLPRLIVSTYPDTLSFANQTWITEQNGLYRATFAHRTNFDGSDFCESLLDASQIFSLNKMIERKGYISAVQMIELRKVAKKLNPSQFRFFELIKTVNAGELEGKELSAEKGDLPMVLLPFFNEKVGLIDATMWTVAAQSTSVHVRRQIEKMPWQIDEDFENVPLDRELYPLAWEIGRSAHNKGADMEILIKAAVIGMLNDVLARGASVKDGYVFTHALGPVQARLFKAKRHPKTNEPLFRVFASHGEPGQNEVLIARLSDMIDTYSPSQFSERIAGVKAITRNRLDDIAATEHIYAIRDHLRQDLDAVSEKLPDRAFPIVLENTTPTPGWFMAKVAEKYNVYDVGPQISKYLSSVPWLDQERRDFRRIDTHIPGMEELAKHKAIGLSNFSRQNAEAYPDYVKLILMGAYFHWERTLRKDYPAQTDTLLNMTQFMVMSSHEAVINQAKAIRGSQAVPMTFKQVSVKSKTDAELGLKVQPHYDMGVTPGIAFNRAAVLALIQANPELAREASKTLRKSNSQIQSMSMDANAF